MTSDAVENFALGDNDMALVDLVDRLIDGGVVLTGDIVLSVADVDLVYVGLKLVLAPAYKVSDSVLRGRGPRPRES